MTSIPTYTLFCDESGSDSDTSFYLAALHCSPRRAELLADALTDVRARYGLTAEMKWTKVSAAYLAAYKAFVDTVLSCRHSSLRILRVKRGSDWHSFGSSSSERFFKAYYTFLRLNMSTYRRYVVTVDDKSGKRHRWSRVFYALNGAARRDYDLVRAHVSSFRAVASHSSDLLQVVDVLLGACTSTATAAPKQALAGYVRGYLRTARCTSGAKCLTNTWTTPPVVWNRPHARNREIWVNGLTALGVSAPGGDA